MNVYPLLTHVAAVTVAAGAGWFAHGGAPVEAGSPPAPMRPVAPAASPGIALAGQPLIAVASDGLVTLRVEQQPLDWVLEQIALQAGVDDLRGRVRPTGAGAATAGDAQALAAATIGPCTRAQGMAAADAQRLVAAIERGSDAERLEGLLAAASSGITLPDEVLAARLASDASARVRRVALELYLEPRGGDPAALRKALAVALRSPDVAVQQEARRRLDELMESGRPEPSDPQQQAAP